MFTEFGSLTVPTKTKINWYSMNENENTKYCMHELSLNSGIKQP